MTILKTEDRYTDTHTHTQTHKGVYRVRPGLKTKTISTSGKAVCIQKMSWIEVKSLLS